MQRIEFFIYIIKNFFPERRCDSIYINCMNKVFEDVHI